MEKNIVALYARDLIKLKRNEEALELVNKKLEKNNTDTLMILVKSEILLGLGKLS